MHLGVVQGLVDSPPECVGHIGLFEQPGPIIRRSSLDRVDHDAVELLVRLLVRHGADTISVSRLSHHG